MRASRNYSTTKACIGILLVTADVVCAIKLPGAIKKLKANTAPATARRDVIILSVVMSLATIAFISEFAVERHVEDFDQLFPLR